MSVWTLNTEPFPDSNDPLSLLLLLGTKEVSNTEELDVAPIVSLSLLPLLLIPAARPVGYSRKRDRTFVLHI